MAYPPYPTGNTPNPSHAVIGEQSADYPRCHVRTSNQRLMTISERNTR